MTDIEIMKRCPKCGSEPMSMVYTSNPPQYGYSHCGIDSGCCKSRSEAVAKWNEQVYLYTHQEKDEEIVKALKCCAKTHNEKKDAYCNECHFNNCSPCVAFLCDRTINLINYLTTTNKNYEATIKRADELIDALKAEIEGLQEELKITRAAVHNNGLEWGLISIKKLVDDTKTKAIKEFAERLKVLYMNDVRFYRKTKDIVEEDLKRIDNLVKEMTEVDK